MTGIDRTMRTLSAVGACVASLALALPGHGQETRVYGTRPDAVMVEVFAQISEEVDERLWQLPLLSVQVHDERTLALTLAGEGGLRFHLPLDPGSDAEEMVELVQGSRGELLRLEYHPSVDAPSRQVHASWTLTSHHGVVGSGYVPLTGRVYSAMLHLVRDDIPDTGVFAAIARAERRLHTLVRHVTEDNGRRVDALADDFLEAAEEGGLPLSFYRTPDGSNITEDTVRQLRDRGHIEAAVSYWNSALRRFRQNRAVNPTLNDFEAAWKRCPSDSVIEVVFPRSRKRRVLTAEALREFRRMAGQRYLDAAVRIAEAGNWERTVEFLRRFREEMEAAGYPPGEFALGDRPARETDFVYLVKLSRGETGFIGWFRAIWHQLLGIYPPGSDRV